jgi:CDP-glycerol glycerophosphotransferase (TagB/SpsB family)/glycosyltransferase involved in cell wall biosynthesis
VLPAVVKQVVKQKAAEALHPASKARIRAVLGARTPDLGRLSVIVPMFNVENYLQDCLSSIVSQSYRNLEVILVDDGSTDGTVEIARTFMRRDKRIKLEIVPHGGNGRARNSGLRCSSGSFVTFADADDIVGADAYLTLMMSLADSGSDFAVGSYDRLVGKSRQPVGLSGRLHATKRVAITSTDLPEIIDDVFLWNKVFRRSFWDRHIGTLPEDVLYEDQETTIRGYLRARSFDVLDEVVYHWRLRSDGTSLTQNKQDLHNLSDRLTVAAAVTNLLQAEGSRELLERWFVRLLGSDLPPFFREITRSPDEYWETLSNGIRSLLTPLEGGEQPGAYLASIGPHEQILVKLALRNARQDVEQVLIHLAENGTGFPLEVHDDELRSTPEYLVDLTTPGLPPSLPVPHEVIRFVTSVRVVRSATMGGVLLRGHAYLAGLPSSIDTSTLKVHLVDPDDGTESGLAVTRLIDPYVDVRSDDPYASHQEAAFTAEIGERQQKESAAQQIPVRLTMTVGTTSFSSLHAVNVTARPTSPGKARRPEVTAFHADDHRMTVNVRDEHQASLSVSLATMTNTLRPVRETRIGGKAEFVFDLSQQLWGQRVAAPASGSYTLRWERHGQLPGPTSSPMAAGEDLAERLPLDVMTSHANLTAWTTTGGDFAVTVAPPLSMGERGRHKQKQLQASYRRRTSEITEPDAAVLFESYGGTVCSDSPRAISDLMNARGSRDVLYWSISDFSVAYPDYAVPVVRGSALWYDALSRAQILVNNNNFPSYFTKSSNQRYLQTWHGTPMKKLGKDAPTGFLSASYRSLMERESASWDVLLAQNAFSATTFQRAFEYGGRILTTGYPRNDVLLSDDRESIRQRVRQLLGIQDHQFAVLYAPTWRDDAKSTRSGHAMVTFLDAVELRNQMGPNLVVLQRGHHNVLGDDRTAGTPPAAIDVSAYPDTADLILASDTLVTDYSSIAFDYAITRKPMYFLVPDLAAYQDVRGLYLDLNRLAPGHLCSTTAQLAAAMTAGRHVVGTQSDEDFRATYTANDDGHASSRVLAAIEEFRHK